MSGFISLATIPRDLRQKSGPIAATARCAALAHMVMSAPATNFYAELYGETGLPPLHLKLGQMLGLMRVDLVGTRCNFTRFRKVAGDEEDIQHVYGLSAC